MNKNKAEVKQIQLGINKNHTACICCYHIHKLEQTFFARNWNIHPAKVPTLSMSTNINKESNQATTLQEKLLSTSKESS